MLLVSRIEGLLARTDPFDLAQAIERHVNTLPGERIRALLAAAAPRMGSYYRAEFARELGTGSDDLTRALARPVGEDELRDALVRFLSGNLRAVSLFGSAFGLAVLERVSGERAVAIGEERPAPIARAAVFTGAALALVLAGAAGEHVVAGARHAAQTPVPIVLAPEPPFPSAEPSPPRRDPKPVTRRIARATVAPAAVPAAAPMQVEPVPPPVPAPRVPASSPAPSRGKGEAVILITAPPQTPSPQPSDLDVTDMPESYSDATPLPEQTAVPVQGAQHAIKLVTPKPSPKHHSWLHRTIMHLDPFKPNPRPT